MFSAIFIILCLNSLLSLLIYFILSHVWVLSGPCFSFLFVLNSCLCKPAWIHGFFPKLHFLFLLFFLLLLPLHPLPFEMGVSLCSLDWNSLCRPGRFWTQRSTYFCLLCNRIKGMHHHTWPKLHFYSCSDMVFFTLMISSLSTVLVYLLKFFTS